MISTWRANVSTGLEKTMTVMFGTKYQSSEMGQSSLSATMCSCPSSVNRSRQYNKAKINAI